MNKVFKLGLVMILFYIFFGYMFNTSIYTTILLIGFALLLITSIYKKKIIFYRQNTFFILLFVWMAISLIYSISRKDTLFFLLYFGIFILVKLVLESESEWQEYILNIIFVFSGIHVFFTILSFLNIDFVSNINKIFMTSSQYKNFMIWKNDGARLGITSDPSLCAFFITNFVAVIYYKLFNAKQKKKTWYLVLLLISFIALILTSKRGPIFANIVAFLIGINLFTNLSKKIKNIFKIIIVAIILGMVLFTFIPLESIFSRLQTNSSSGALSGREVLYEKMFKRIQKDPIIGIGTFCTNKYLNGFDGHNIYIQMFVENGVIGILLQLMLFITNINYTLKKIKNDENNYLLRWSLYIQLYFLIYGLTGNPFYNPFILCMYFIATSFNLKYKEIKKEYEKNTDTYIS